MKKIYLFSLALVFILSIACTAVAAPGPFSDVPAKHWAYDAIKQLYKAGIVDGDQSCFLGDTTMTRYEMALIVARAMERSNKADAENKVIVDKLSVEFAVELNNLGVHVTNSEKQVSNFTLSGDASIRHINWSSADESHAFQENYRLALTARINDDTTMFSRVLIVKQSTFGQNTNNDNELVEAGFQIRNFLGHDNVTLTVGRFNQMMSATGSMMNYWGVDGAKIAFGNEGNKLQVELGYATFENPSTAFTSISDIYNGEVNPLRILNQTYGQLIFDDAMFATLKYAANDTTTLFGQYITNKVNTGSRTRGSSKVNVWGLGVAKKLGSDVTFKGDYIRNQEYSNQNTAVYTSLLYKGAIPSQPHSWGLNVGYNKAYANASFGWGDFNTTALYLTTDIQNYVVGADYTLAKNIIFKATQSFNSRIPETNAKDKNGEWTRAQVEFLF
jgi:hypothetical protein